MFAKYLRSFKSPLVHYHLTKFRNVSKRSVQSLNRSGHPAVRIVDSPFLPIECIHHAISFIRRNIEERVFHTKRFKDILLV